MKLQSYKVFKKRGAELMSPDFFTQKARQIKVLIFDWDGVFHDGKKDKLGNSLFSEIDAMGINMLRFGYYLSLGELPKTFIITGEENHTGFALAKREHFDAVYFKIKNKTEVLGHLKDTYGVDPIDVLFVFDDILDVSLASKVGLRLMVKNDATPLLKAFCKAHKHYDYYTCNNASNNAIRECCELVLESIGRFRETLEKRVHYEPDYNHYVSKRNRIETAFFRLGDNNAVLSAPVV